MKKKNLMITLLAVLVLIAPSAIGAFSAHPGVPSNNVDLSDYILRHPELFQASSAAPIDSSDYPIRHPDMRIPAPAAPQDTSDYWLRHCRTPLRIQAPSA